jgi:PAS domain-containing protein
MGVVDDAPPDDALQARVRKIAESFGTPIALVSVILEDRQWFKAYHGIAGELLARRGSPRGWSFCQHVVEGKRALVIPDAREHPVLASNPFVVSGQVTGYVGAPLETASGEVLGTLCVLDKRPLALDAVDIGRLVEAARAIAGELEVSATRRRLASVAPPALQPVVATLEALLGALDAGLVLLGPDRRVLFANEHVRTFFDVDPATLIGLTRDDLVSRLATSFVDARDTLSLLRVPSTGAYVLRTEVDLARPVARRVRWVGVPIVLADGVGQVISFRELSEWTA